MLPMRSEAVFVAVLVLFVLASTGCGAKAKAENRRLRDALERAAQRALAVRSEYFEATRLLEESKRALAAQEKSMGELSSKVNEAEARNAVLRAELLRLENPEDTAFADAEAASHAGERSKALRCYKAFARDFPQSLRREAAEAEAKGIERAVAREKWESEAPARAQAAAAAWAARAQQDYAKGLLAGIAFARVSENELVSEAQLDRQVAFWKRSAQTSPDMYEKGYRHGFQDHYWVSRRLKSVLDRRADE